MAMVTRGETHSTGEHRPQATPGGLACVECGYTLSIFADDTLPHCPACGGRSFRRAGLFTQSTVDIEAVERADHEPDAVAAARERLAGEGPHLVWAGDDGAEAVELPVGWSKIGRSGTADIQLDDPTVSRRHALVVRTPDGKLKALDDRSLNGLFVNGSRVEWAPLDDGDELEIGRFRLYVVL